MGGVTDWWEGSGCKPVCFSSWLLRHACNAGNSCNIDDDVMYTATGFNAVYGHSFRKLYNDQDYMSATFVRLVKQNPALNTHISREESNYICCA